MNNNENLTWIALLNKDANLNDFAHRIRWEGATNIQQLSSIHVVIFDCLTEVKNKIETWESVNMISLSFED